MASADYYVFLAPAVLVRHLGDDLVSMAGVGSMGLGYILDFLWRVVVLHSYFYGDF